VPEVLLSYTVDEGETWVNVTMDCAFGCTYVGAIPGFEAGTHVLYKIMAYDRVNNLAVADNAGEYYVCTVSPEFQGFVILVWMTVMLVVVVLAKRRKQQYSARFT